MIASRAWRLPIVVLASMAALLLLPPLLGLAMGVVELLGGDAASPRALGFRGGATATVARPEASNRRIGLPSSASVVPA